MSVYISWTRLANDSWLATALPVYPAFAMAGQSVSLSFPGIHANAFPVPPNA